jgi:hypothetical protein
MPQAGGTLKPEKNLSQFEERRKGAKAKRLKGFKPLISLCRCAVAPLSRFTAAPLRHCAFEPFYRCAFVPLRL